MHPILSRACSVRTDMTASRHLHDVQYQEVEEEKL